MKTEVVAWSYDGRPSAGG